MKLSSAVLFVGLASLSITGDGPKTRRRVSVAEPQSVPSMSSAISYPDPILREPGLAVGSIGCFGHTSIYSRWEHSVVLLLLPRSLNHRFYN